VSEISRKRALLDLLPDTVECTFWSPDWGLDWNFAGGMQGLHSNYGSFNVPNMQGSLASRNAAAAAMSGVPSSGVQQPGGGISSGRFGSNNLPVAMSQVLCFSVS